MVARHELSLQIVEVLHYSLDVDKSVGFYEGKLGWPVIWQSPGNLAIIDAGGAYQVTVVAAQWIPGWKDGDPIPAPKLAMESQDLASDKAVLTERKLHGLVISGDPASMLTMEIADPEGFQIFVWQDSAGAGATKMVEDYKAESQPPARYTLGECLFFVVDMPGAEKFYTDKLGFSVRSRHGEAFTGLSRKDGPVLGLYDSTKWWDSDSAVPAGTVRLFLECPDISAEHVRLNAAGAAPGTLCDSGDGLRWFSVADPDGNTMTLWQYESPVH